MPTRDIVVIGTSAGGISALSRLLERLPPKLPAAIFVVLHIGKRSSSFLDSILSRVGPLPATFAQNGEAYRRGRVYIAPPDMHLIIRGGRTHLRRSARENLSRPAIDPLFRSAAAQVGERTIGIVMSGALSDGSAGLRAIKQCGGLAFVQDPKDADVAEMPSSAIAWVKPDVVATASALADVLVEYTKAETSATRASCPEIVRREDEFVFSNGVNHMREQPGTRSVFSCPACSGALWEIREGDLVRYRCHVGHAFTDAAMMEANGDELERALWIALRVLEERIELLRSLARRESNANRRHTASRFLARADEYEAEAGRVRKLLESGNGTEFHNATEDRTQ